MSVGGIVIQPAGAADLDAVMDVMDASFEPRFGEAWTRAQCAGLLPMPGVWLSLARDGDMAVGFALARAVADEAELLLLAVRETVQRRGIGTLLLRQFETDAGGRGVGRLHLEVREGNQALGLYERGGFALVGRRRNYYSGYGGLTYDALTLAKAVDKSC